MGISAVEFRFRIGLFNSKMHKTISSSVQQPSECKFGLSFKHVPVAALCLLLLISGIEPNPGPDTFQCKYCGVVLETVSAYVKHLPIHSHWRNFTVPCVYCKIGLKNVRSFQAHLARKHSKPNSEVAPTPALTVYKSCEVPSCGVIMESRTDFMRHMAFHLRSGQSLTCGISNEPGVKPCETKLDNVRKFQVHMSRHHPPSKSVSSITAAREEGYNPSLFYEYFSEDIEGDDTYEEFSGNISEAEDLPQNPFPANLIKDDIARFYLKLEGECLLPTTTVQIISQEIKRLTEYSHHSLKEELKNQLSSHNLADSVIQSIIHGTFEADPVFNVHHKGNDIDHLGTHHLRNKYWNKKFPFVEPTEIYFGVNEAGKKRTAQYLPVRQTLEVLLRDKQIQDMIVQSFNREENDSGILADFCDGTAYKAHRQSHNDGKCLQLLLFEDAFDFTAFGPSAGVHKPNGFYYTLGNMPAEVRSKVDIIQMTYMLLDKDMQPSMQEEIDDVDVMKEALKPLLEELEDLKVNGIVFNGKKLPVCLLFLLGDNLGQHTIGGYVRSFNAEFVCRFCDMSKTQFLATPYEVNSFRTPEDYDLAVEKAKLLYDRNKKKALAAAKKAMLSRANRRTGRTASRLRAPASRSLLKTKLIKSALKKLRAVNYRGIKYRHSPFNNRVLNFHVSAPALPPCLAHDIFEGILKHVLARVLKYCVDVKEWFDFQTLNRRIKRFRAKGTDALDPPKPLKSLDELSGNACQNWNMLRLLPFIVGDLIAEPHDPVWQLYLSLKEICEYVCAPRITVLQVAYLRNLIRAYLSSLKILAEYFPKCLIPKQHFLCHYPDLILLFGPLIRLFTLRYESKHVFFKRVARTCKNYINILYTLTRKYVCKFAYDHSTGLLPPDIIFDPSHALVVSVDTLSEEVVEALPNNFNFENYEFSDSLIVKGIRYDRGHYLILGYNDNSTGLIVGLIDFILLDRTNNVTFLLREKDTINTFNGYYLVTEPSTITYRYQIYEDLPDYYPLPSYFLSGSECISLKHSFIGM